MKSFTLEVCLLFSMLESNFEIPLVEKSVSFLFFSALQLSGIQVILVGENVIVGKDPSETEFCLESKNNIALGVGINFECRICDAPAWPEHSTYADPQNELHE